MPIVAEVPAFWSASAAAVSRQQRAAFCQIWLDPRAIFWESLPVHWPCISRVTAAHLS